MSKIGYLYYRWFDDELIQSKWDVVNHIISEVTDHPATHVGICINETDTDYIMFESTPKGNEVRKFNKGWFDREIENGDWVWQKVKGLNIIDLQEKAEELLNIKYGWFDYIKFITFYHTGLRLFPGSLDKMVCSESIILLLHLQGLNLGLYDDIYKFDYISPGKLYDVVDAFNGGLKTMKKKHVNVKVEEEKEYSYIIGVWKSIKNVLITFGIPALTYLLNNWQEWMPEETVLKLSPLIGAVSYFVKNKYQFKG